MTSSVSYPDYHHHHASHRPPPLRHHPVRYHRTHSVPLQRPFPLPHRTYRSPHHSTSRHQHHHHHHHLHHPQHPYCAPPAMAAPDLSEMEQMQRLSDNYHPDLPGPFIGDKLPMNNLVSEYAQADPAFVVKTQALAATHSGYRAIKGDGQCGWRGAVFSYFELLLELGQINLAEEEELRLRTFEDTMRMAGIEYDMLEDLFTETWSLFAKLKEAIRKHDKSDRVILEFLNDTFKSDPIVYHFKMMTSAFMQMNGDNYEPFLEEDVSTYRISRIEATGQEIDQIGLQVLTDAVISQAGFALDVLYLDRSVGAEVTPHEFAPKNTGGPTIRLLYRPGHYDVIYKGTPPVQVFMQKESLVNHRMYMSEASTLHPDLQAFVYGGSHSSGLSSPSSNFFFGTDSGSQHQRSHQPSYFSTENGLTISSPYASTSSTYVGHIPQHAFHHNVSSPPSTLAASPHSPTPKAMSGCMPMPPSSFPVSSLGTQSDGGPAIRLTQYVKQYERMGESVPLSTSAFGNAAALSPAHFRNQEFQPQMWSAEDDYGKS